MSGATAPDDGVIRIAMWSGPRNISTAMMRAFGARTDTWVIDEPFYAAYLAKTGSDHPMKEEVLRAQPTDWRQVVGGLLGPTPEERPVFYQKHMAHHLLPGFGREWTGLCRNAFLIRDPAAVLASYVKKRSEVELADIGVEQQHELFVREADRLGRAPPVVEGPDVLSNPAGMLRALCGALGLTFKAEMLSWPPGRRSTDGVWAPAWYEAVERSTSFAPPKEEARPALPPHLQRVSDLATPAYEALRRHRLAPVEEVSD